MGTFASFEEIKAWQESRLLVKSIRNICKRENVKKDFSLIDQITRAARSVSANIAEGNDAFTVPDFVKFLVIAKQSCAEVRSHLYDVRDEGYITASEFSELSELCRKICRMLAQLIRYLMTIDTKKRRLNPSSKLEN